MDLSAGDSSKNVGGSCYLVVLLLSRSAVDSVVLIHFNWDLIGKDVQSFCSRVPKMAVVSREASLCSWSKSCVCDISKWESFGVCHIMISEDNYATFKMFP